MPDHPAFLRAILDDPDDDAPRLVYADWLDEHRQPDRAEFIRRGCELARLWGPDDPTRETIERRKQLDLVQSVAWQTHRMDWYPALSRVDGEVARERLSPESWFVRPGRGFPDAWAAPADRFLAHAGEIFAEAPTLRWIGVSWAREGQVAGVAAMPQLGHATALEISLAQVGETDVRALLNTPHLRDLAEFRWSTRGNSGATPEIEGQLARGIGSLPQFARLRSLAFGGAHFGDDGAAHFLRGLPGLESLALDLGRRRSGGSDQTVLTSRTTSLLAERECFPELRRLDLRRCGLADEAVRWLARARHLSQLRTLGLSDNPIGDAGAAALARANWCSLLRTLDLGSTALTDAGTAALFWSPGLAGIREWRLWRVAFGPRAAEAFMAHPRPALRDFDLPQSRNGSLADPISLALIDWAAVAPRLERLTLSGVGFRSREITELVHNLPGSLENLGLGENLIGREGVAALARCASLRSLRWLSLDNAGLGDDEARVLSESPYLENACLSMYGNPVTDVGKAALYARFGKARVTGLEPYRPAGDALQIGVACSHLDGGVRSPHLPAGPD